MPIRSPVDKMQVQARDKRALIGGSLAVTALLAYLLWPSGEPSQTSVELVPKDQQPPSAAPSPPPPARVETGIVGLPTAPGMLAPASGPAPEGLSLTGIAGTGAIFAFADGTQRFVAIGRQVMPGLTLQDMGIRHVDLGSASTTVRMSLGAAAQAAPAPAAPTVPVATTALPPATAAPSVPRPSAADAGQSPVLIDGRVPSRSTPDQ
jgi:hypothetical protein